MSLAVEKVTPVTVHDPRVVQQERVYPVLKGGQEVLYKQFTTNAVSSSSVHFVCPPPSQNLYVDRRIHLRLPVELDCSIASGLIDDRKLFNPSCFAIRSFPLQKAMETVQMTINNQSMSINIGDVLSALEHFNISDKLRQVDFSKCATYPVSQFQNLSDSWNAVAASAHTDTSTGVGLPQYYRSQKSALALWEESPAGSCQKQMPFVVTENPDTASNAVANAKIQFVSTEPLFLSPLFWGDCDHDDSAFYGVNNMSFTFNFVGAKANRMLAIDFVGSNLVTGLTEAAARALTMTSTASFNPSAIANAISECGSYEAALLFQYITPQLTDRGQAMNKVLNYPYFNIERWPSNAQSVGSQTEVTFTSNNVQLSSIPSKIYIFVRPTNSVLQKNPAQSDCFAAIKSVNLQWGNRSGLLASASIQQLYDISVRAGCCLSYNDWAGVPLAKAASPSDYGSAGNQVYGSGSVLAIDPIDLGLDAIDAPGKLQKTSLYCSVQAINRAETSLSMELYVVAVSQGIFTLFNGQASSLIGVLNSNDVLNSHEQTSGQMLSYSDARRMYGGNFLSDIKSDLRSLAKKKKPKMMGMGANSGGAVSGAARVSRQSLAERLN